jgi:two-component system, cell cycle response regulator DivK
MPPSNDLPFRPRGCCVLIVSNHPETSDMYAAYLTSKGFAVATATYADAVARGLAVRPDALTADLDLPFEAAFSVCRKFKAHPSTRGIPIVALTGYASARIHADAVLAGCGSVLLKPVTPDEFLTAICRALGLPEPSDGDHI